MPVDVRVAHPQFAAQRASVMAARDCLNGERAVKSRSDLYLPRLSGQKPDDYEAYKKRATFYSIVARTVSALTGLATQGEIIKKGNEDTLKQMTDAPHGMQLIEAFIFIVSELLLQGRMGILLDAPEQAQELGILAYVSDCIINWAPNPDGSYKMVVLHERHTIADKDNRFKLTEVDRYRVLELIGGIYTVQMYDEKSNPIGPLITPKFNGKVIDYLPFWTATPVGLSSGIPKSPMEDMVNINLSHYRTSADLEHGRHFCGLPTPVVSGTDTSTRLKVGGNQAWILPDKDAKAYYLEFKGEGLASLEKALTEKEAQLVSLSASLMDRSARGSESPDAIRLRMSSETASLLTIVRTTQTLLNLVYNTKSELEGNKRDIEMTMPTQFISGKLTSKEVSDYSKVYLEGGITLEAYVDILRRGGALSASRTDDEEKAGLRLREEARAAAEAATLAAKSKQPTSA